MSKPKYVIVIGASAGGLNALSELVGQLKPGLGAAVFVVLHLSKKGIADFLLYRLQPFAQLPCSIALDGEKIETDHIYFAALNKHLVIKDGQIILGQGPEENRWRPSIDILFRSAAVAYRVHAIGIILTGYLSDGTSGMHAIKRCGGVTIVQDPNEAEVPAMPLSVMENMEVDHCVTLQDMGPLLNHIIQFHEPEDVDIPPEIIREAEIALTAATGIEEVSPIAENSVYSCPDCGGVLWQVKEDAVARYRCNTGHVYSEKELFVKQSEALESTLWVAVRIMEERKNLMQKLAGDYRRRGLQTMAGSYQQKADDMRQHIQKLKDLLFISGHDEETERLSA